jgi:hypothetical protein
MPRSLSALLPAVAWIALAAPAFVALTFVHRYATPMPLTDEWLFLRGAMREEIVWKIYDHIVIVPYLIYRIVVQASNFDNRALVLITLLCVGTQTWLFARYIIGSVRWTVPVAILLFSPSHYMELLWGFQFTLALSIALPIAGIVVADRIRPTDEARRAFRLAGIAVGLVLLGGLSSAGGAFGFVACAVLPFLKPFSLRRRLVSIAVLVPLTCAFFVTSAGKASVSTAKVWQGLTMLGAPVFGMPVALTSFSPDQYAFAGAIVVACVAATLVIARRDQQLLSRLALPAAIFAFSALASAATVAARAYLGNWHLQYAVPAICAAYAMAYVLWRERGESLPLGGMLALVTLAISGYVAAFARHGPDYLAYARSIEHYARNVTGDPGLKKPFPVTGGWDFDAEMAAYLTKRGHPSLAPR